MRTMKLMRLIGGLVAFSVAASTITLLWLPAPANARVRPAIPSDFNGDGYADLAVGVPGEDIGPKVNAGAVNVLYGSKTGLTAVGDQLWSQHTPGVKGRRFANEHFGAALASGDFDRDGYADLAIGVPRDKLATGTVRAGAVNVLYGSKTGLTAAGDQLWSRANLPDPLPRRADFGGALAAGDFDGDGYWDLAIGESRPFREGHQGSVWVLRGGPEGLTVAGVMTLTRQMTGAPAFDNDAFGFSLAAGDLNGDSLSDLAVGTPEFWLGPDDGWNGEGHVAVFHGSAAGLSADGSQLWGQDSPSIEGDAEDGDRFGWSLAIGDFDGDGLGDLAAGVPGDDAVNVLYGSAPGLTADGNQLWHEDVPGVPGVWEPGDGFGTSLAAGDFDGDGPDELAIGVPTKGPPGLRISGAVVVLPGSRDGGLTATGAQAWTQDSAGVPGSRERNNGFGWRLASANFGRSARADLAIGSTDGDAGKVFILYGRVDGLSGRHAQAWSQETPGVTGTAERGDSFGWVLIGSNGGPPSWWYHFR